MLRHKLTSREALHISLLITSIIKADYFKVSRNKDKNYNYNFSSSFNL
jgi:hypothetical protein